MTEQPASGLLVVDKPAGWTSHQVVARCRRLLGTRKVGHAGTLDPMATGLLLVGYGRATRLLGHLAGHDKTYTATIRLGQDTNTDDADGEVTAASGASGVTASAIEHAVGAFRGPISQVPSSVSAIKVDGSRAYALVRSGQQVELAARPVTISRFDVLAVRAGAAQAADGSPVPVVDVEVEVDCSSGTYIRALARDLGGALGCGGHLAALRRTRVGGFTLADTGLAAAGLAEGVTVAPLGLAEVARRSFPVVEVDQAQARDVGFGRALDLDLTGETTALLHDGQLLALYRGDGAGRALPVAVLV